VELSLEFLVSDVSYRIDYYGRSQRLKAICGQGSDGMPEGIS
jgi:hypothetical protein